MSGVFREELECRSCPVAQHTPGGERAERLKVQRRQEVATGGRIKAVSISLPVISSRQIFNVRDPIYEQQLNECGFTTLEMLR